MDHGPWTWHPHVVAWLVVAAVAMAGRRSSRRAVYLSGLIALAAATTWPLADLARQWSVLALVGSHLLLMLVAVPLLLVGLPEEVGARLTPLPVVDAAVAHLARPLVGTAVFNGVVVGTHLPAVVDWQARSAVGFGTVEVVLAMAATLMWLVVIPAVPGLHRPSGLGRVAYLLVQSIVPNVPGSFLTFSSAPLFAAYAGHTSRLGLSPVLDQQLAGAAAKIVAAGILWSVAAVAFFRVVSADRGDQDPDPLRWADVERELARVERGERHRRPAG